MKYFALLSLFCYSVLCYSQDYKPKISFEANTKQNLSFAPVPKNPWQEKYPWVKRNNNDKKHLPVKMLAEGETDWVKVTCSDSTGVNWHDIDFYFGSKLLIPKIISPYEAEIRIENPLKAYELGAYFQDKVIARVRTVICPKRTRKIILIPLVSDRPDQKLLSEEVNRIFQQGNLQIQLEIKPQFSSKVFTSNSEFGLPDRKIDRYTGQMRLLRDQYFKENPNLDKSADYIFLLPTFTDSSTMGFMIGNKSLGFLPYQSNPKALGIELARTICYGMGLTDIWNEGPPEGLADNLMDTVNGTRLEFFQIQKWPKEPRYFSLRDAFEFVKTGNGTVAYFFWEENDKGEIVWTGKSPLQAIKRPYKKNYLSFRFNLESPLLRPLFRIGKYYISVMNFLFVAIVIFLLFFLRRWVKRFWTQKEWPTFPRRLLFWSKVFLSVWFISLSFPWGNALLEKYTLLNGPLPELKGKSYVQTQLSILYNSDFSKRSAYSSCSEILIQKNKNWEFKSPKRVMYFNVRPNKEGKNILRYNTSSDQLVLKQDSISEYAQNHYVVFSTYTKNGDLSKQEVFTYDGKKVQNIKEKPNLSKRILVFVNGYRPTSTGQTLEENFAGIQSKGFEYPSSTNYIYTFDRYEYWERWGEINLQFQSKINPSATFYADGHFSVSTSNYRSLLNFSRISQAYPDRCKNPKKHVCHRVKTDNFLRYLIPTTETEKLIKMTPNQEGFNYRMQKGKIAGLNLLQEINFYPNISNNDTLFIVAHSMGYAYALGMIESLRGRIQFGGFYIIAPENAISGKVDPSEWPEIWQYGSRFYLENSDAPCLQDGVAPQTGAKGLPYGNRAFIPEDLYTRKGFFDSHFIGYYDWILSLSPEEKGFIKQR